MGQFSIRRYFERLGYLRDVETVVEMVSTHDLYRQRKTWLAALVRAVFVLTQCNVSPVETVRELDEKMCSQWSWSIALDS